ncbi:hypothetical protein ATANTOWER_016443 [Ataeniobius toweri]|uniref:Uncharacterized protein n=1 Tax=Ataeniobius toweri TaxID=208326 RepID=A0ABU7AY75_9TELE|nr:hypothetical protein [Ataeniobius toweri]
MDLVSWSLNAIDQIFSTRRQGEGEPNLSGLDVFLWIHNGLLAEVEDCVFVNNVSRGCGRYVYNWMFDIRISAFWSQRLPGISRNSENVSSCSGNCEAACHV